MCTLTERRWLIVAFQTGCAAAGGLNCLPDVVADDEGRELVQHGSALFPIACYEEDLKSYSVAWHWHEEFEYILAVKGPLAVDVSKARLVLQTGQGVFVNSGVFHAVEQAETGDALLHSGVFHPRLIGGMDTIFWQKLVHPLLQPGAPAFFLLDEADDGQKAVLCHLREVWDAVAQEVFDYENQARYHLSAAVHLLGMQCEGGKTKVSQQEQIAAQRMKQMLRFVEEHYAEELNVERISDCVALSESACLRSFRQLLGITPIQYVKQYRIEKAPGSRPARWGWNAAFRTRATLSRPSGRSSTARPESTVRSLQEESSLFQGGTAAEPVHRLKQRYKKENRKQCSVV